MSQSFTQDNQIFRILLVLVLLQRFQRQCQALKASVRKVDDDVDGILKLRPVGRFQRAFDVDREVVHDRHVLQAVVVKHRQLREIEVRRRGPTFLRNDFLFLNRGSSLIVRIRKFSFFFFVTLVQFIYGTSRDMERQ